MDFAQSTPNAEEVKSAQMTDTTQSRQAMQLETPSLTHSDSGLSPKAQAEAKRIQQFLTNREHRTFIGKPITIQVRDMDVVDVFRIVAEASGFNIVIGDEVQGKLTLSLLDVPWDQALSVILQQMGLAAERSNNILRIMTLESLRAEKVLEYQAKLASQVAAPRITRFFPISYADLTELSGLLGRFQNAAITTIDTGTAAGGAAAAAVQATQQRAGAANQPIILSDRRTNSLIIRDTVESMDRIQKLIELLDTQTPQIQIEGKVIEATETFAKNINGTFAFGVNGPNPLFGSFAGGGASQALLSTLADTSTNGASFSIAFLPNIRSVNARLNLEETEDRVKVLSSPKLVVLNKQAATITQTQPVAFQTTTIVGGVVTTNFTVLTATLSLNVTPSVTNDGSVLMQLTLTRDVPQSAGPITAVAARNINTQVVVDSGTTLVLGGIYTTQSSVGERGLPFLRKIPLLGSLFGGDSQSTSRSELFFFVTPQIINPKRAGLTTAGS